MAFDVCVVGGGPSGAAAALTLARYTRHRVCLVEATRYEEMRVGETVSAAVLPLLSYLGADGVLATQPPQAQPPQAAALPGFGTAAAWGSPQLMERDFIFTGRGQGWHLDRRSFDRALAAALEPLGGAWRIGTTVREVLPDGVGWVIRTDGAEELSARVIIDATGRQARIARRLGAERVVSNRLVGLVCHLALPDGPTPRTTLVEAVAEGWWYTAPLPGGRAVAALMTDADLLRGLCLEESRAFLGRLAATTHAGPRLAGALPLGEPRAFPAESHVLDRVCGPAWVAAGDAASAFDPLASLGIGHALASGIQAARIADGLLKGDTALAEAYPGDIARHRAAYETQSRAIHAAERRWPDAPFWARRQAAAQ